ncbi:MAG: lysoplasmalogenase [Sphingomonadaceae bacterium]|nr:MAG: lysoplasmalogenase [Sphingomonadaceae bacterium]
MSKHALIDHRPWLLASLAAAIAFYLLRDNPIGGLWLIMLKASGVGLLAAYAWWRGVGQDGLLLTIYLALGALGDALIEIDLTYGGAAFFAGHLAVIALFLRYPREEPTSSQKGAGVTLLLFTPLLCWLLSGSLQIALYGLALGGMAAAAWLSSFSRYRVGIGAVLFVVSDLLIFSEIGPVDLGPAPDMLIWPLYYLGQFLIAIGVVQALLAAQLSTAWQR